MPLDQNQDEIPDKVIEDLENPKAPEQADKDEKVEDENKVPFHQDPQVQAYIERQVAKRIGEGNQAWETRLAKLEDNLTKSIRRDEPVNIAGWTPATEAEAKAAQAIIKQAKDEIINEFKQADEATRETQTKEDHQFRDWLGELRTTNVLKTDSEEKEFARLIVEYKLEDQQAAVNLWNRLQQSVEKAKEEGTTEGIKKMQEAKVGSSRTTGAPGDRTRSYQERKLAEPNFDAIVERELTRLGH